VKTFQGNSEAVSLAIDYLRGTFLDKDKNIFEGNRLVFPALVYLLYLKIVQWNIKKRGLEE